ncbi:hypothetical protein [Streptomyces europaeiscabiei]|uniref:hypothetical protein n=1 Tax=Streptomyces europaeiscabiei TaxID=146819 RepID=UPI0038F715F1
MLRSARCPGDGLLGVAVGDGLAQLLVVGASADLVVVAQRLENTKIADRIIVMEHGRITEEGTNDELAAGWRTFAALPALSHDRCHPLPPAPLPPGARAHPFVTDEEFRAPALTPICRIGNRSGRPERGGARVGL